jgi:hypothetical protein
MFVRACDHLILDFKLAFQILSSGRVEEPVLRL